ncbi:MAG: RHS repeat protein, partial [Nitrososphaerota archaeon]|nr:RHS repeat protein [Nitrososphaerota archaeon]
MQKSVLALIICVVLLSPQYLGSVNLGAPIISFASASSNGVSQLQPSSGTPLPPGKVNSIDTLSNASGVVQSLGAFPPFFSFNSTGLFWGNMEMKLPIESIAGVTNQCTFAESSTLTNNDTTYDYSFSGSFSGDCGTFGGAIQSTLNVYVDNITGSTNKEVYISGRLAISGTGNVSNLLILPLSLPSSYSVNSDSVNSSSTSFDWTDMSQYSPFWNSTLNALTVQTPYVNGSSIITFSYDPTLVQTSGSGLCSTSSITVSYPSAVTKYDLLVAAIGEGGYPVSSVSDTLGNTWNDAVYAKGSYLYPTYIWYTNTSSSGSDTLTVNLTGSNECIGVVLYEVFGVTTVGLQVATGSGTGGSSEYTGTTVSWSGTQGFLVAVSGPIGTSQVITPGAGFTAENSASEVMASEYSTSGVTSPTDFPMTISPSGYSWTEAAAYFPFVQKSIPNAGTSSSSWSKPGLSPFESYFTHESEYVSPGNGLLGVEQTDYSLSGRGLGLAITRVYSQPYAFNSSVPYMYDNYTLSNLGLGWQLNFPWMGATYLHLSDGQVYKYNWAGSVFLNNGGTPFRLINNTGSSYDLYLGSGVDYHFDSAKHLVSITDPTGSNVIRFNYGSNNYISSINDSTGRTVSFSYDSNNQLTMVSTDQGNFLYGYSGSNLVSATDPIGRVTTYHYNTGINDWLVSSVDYPTGAYTDYVYGNATVGPGIITYYVALQNVHVSSNDLSKTTSYSYNVDNGLVTFCNSSISDGSGVQSYTLYNFTNPSKTTKTVENSSGQAILSYENIYDPLGRINETEILSPSNSTLAYTTSEYDNWSNVIYTRNYDGQQAWFSYANTNTTDAFYYGASGFTDSFYTNNSISSNIHDLLVGQAQYQNGSGTNKIEIYYDYNSVGEL